VLTDHCLPSIQLGKPPGWLAARQVSELAPKRAVSGVFGANFDQSVIVRASWGRLA
jgi:hypothetical protein